MDTFHYSREAVTQIGTDSNFALLIKNSCYQLDQLGYFHDVACKVFATPTVKSPACFIQPMGMQENTDNSNQAVRDMQYTIRPLVHMKQPKEDRLILNLCFLAQKVGRIFTRSGTGNTPLLFTADVPAHWNTEVQPTTMEPVVLSSHDVIFYTLGINIVFSVWENKSNT